MIVVDTNIIGHLFLSSDLSSMSEDALRKDSEWAAPLLWRSELRNVLALYMRKDIITLNDAQMIMDKATDLMQGQEYEVSSAQVLNLTSERNCSAYDCEFVALAQELGVNLIALDRQILEQSPRQQFRWMILSSSKRLCGE